MPSGEKHSKPKRNIVGDRVREARSALQPPITQDQLAGKLAAEGVQLDRVAIAKVESGMRSVFDFEVKALSCVLRVDVVWLLGISGKNTGPTAPSHPKRR